MLSDGSYGTIDSIGLEALLEPETTYNFEVADFHTYYVGEQSICVHNANCYLDPNDIRYTQDSGKDVFTNGSHEGESVEELVKALKNGSVSADYISALKVFKHSDGNIYSINNRRFYAYKTAGIKKVPVEFVDKSGTSMDW